MSGMAVIDVIVLSLMPCDTQTNRQKCIATVERAQRMYHRSMPKLCQHKYSMHTPIYCNVHMVMVIVFMYHFAWQSLPDNSPRECPGEVFDYVS